MADSNMDENTNINGEAEKELKTEAETPDKKDKSDKKKKSVGREIFEWVYSIVIAVVIAMLIKCFLFDVVKVDGQSMENTLFDRDRLIVTKLGYSPEQGDIVILDSNYTKREVYYDRMAEQEGKDELSGFEKFKTGFSLPSGYDKVYYVKRVIATEGQTVDIRDGKVFVDGAELSETYAKGTTYPIDATVEFPQTVAEGCVFVMGDNREHSSDSRVSTLGQVPEEAILGKSQLRIYPFGDIGITR